jgi:hypothetical protein
MSDKQKQKPRPAWTLYALLKPRPFADDLWLQRWIRLKEELKLAR